MGYKVRVKDKIRTGDLVVLYSDPDNDFIAVPTALFLSKTSIDWREYTPNQNDFIADIARSDRNVHVILNPAAVYANGAVRMPSFALDGQEVTVTTTKNIANLNIISSHMDSVLYSEEILLASRAIAFRYCASKFTWYRLG